MKDELNTGNSKKGDARMYLLTSDLGSLGSANPAPETPKVLSEFDLIIDRRTSICRSGDKRRWKVHTANVSEKGIELIIKPLYARATSKKTRFGILLMPHSGFKKISSSHLAINYRNKDGKLQMLILTAKHLVRSKPVLVKEIYTTQN